MDLYQNQFESPIGLINVVSDGKHVRAIDFEGYEPRLHRLLALHYGAYILHAGNDPVCVASRLKDYFDGDLRAVDDIPISTNGTPFQQLVWATLRSIPPGTTLSYGTLAAQIGQPKACRAVGLANGSNPISIVVPCHRVIGANKSLTGYGGGIERKQWLLRHEGVTLSVQVKIRERMCFIAPGIDGTPEMQSRAR